jgi:hypothetical protein
MQPCFIDPCFIESCFIESCFIEPYFIELDGRSDYPNMGFWVLGVWGCIVKVAAGVGPVQGDQGVGP